MRRPSTLPVVALDADDEGLPRRLSVPVKHGRLSLLVGEHPVGTVEPDGRISWNAADAFGDFKLLRDRQDAIRVGRKRLRAVRAGGKVVAVVASERFRPSVAVKRALSDR